MDPCVHISEGVRRCIIKALKAEGRTEMKEKERLGEGYQCVNLLQAHMYVQGS